MNNHQLSALFQLSCQNGHLEAVQQLVDMPGVFVNPHFKDDKALALACEYGHLAIVRYLLTSPSLASHYGATNINARDGEALRIACYKGHLHIVQYLLTSPEITQAGGSHADIHACNDDAFKMACYAGHVNIMAYLINPPTTENGSPMFEAANIYAAEHRAFLFACESGCLEAVKFFFQSPLVQQYERNHLDSPHQTISQYILEKAVEYALRGESMDIVRFLVCETHLHNNPFNSLLQTPEIQSIFSLNELNSKLQQTLNSSTASILKRSKI